MDPTKHDYFLETTTYRKIKPISGEVNQTPTPDLPTITHLSLKVHTEIFPPILMMSIIQMGTKIHPILAMHRSDLSQLSSQQQAEALAVTTIQAIYEGDISKPTVVLAETAEMANLLDGAFREIKSDLTAKAAIEEENALAEGNGRS